MTTMNSKENLDLCLRWIAEEKRYEVFERGGTRRLHHIASDVYSGQPRIEVTPAFAYFVAPPSERLGCRVTVYGVAGVPEIDERICARLEVCGTTVGVPMKGQDALRVVDAATGRPFGQTSCIEAEAMPNSPFEITFTFRAEDNEPSPEHLAEYEALREQIEERQREREKARRERAATEAAQ